MNFSVTKNGEPLSEELYTWDEKTRTFSTKEDDLVLDFSGWDGCTFKTGRDCTFKTGHCCTFFTGGFCTFKTGADCTFDTGTCCTFNTYGNCTFDTGDNCTFDTGDNCTFDTGDCCVIVRRDEFEIIQPERNEVINLCPSNIPGYISKRKDEDAFYKEIDGKRVEHIIADGILSEVIKKRGNVYHVKNYGEDEITYLIKDGELYSHGATLKEARDSLKFKISDRDTSEYENFTLDTELTEREAIGMYMTITGACERGTKYFYDNVLAEKDKKDKYTVKEVIELTKGQYNHNELVEFFKINVDSSK